MPRVFPFPGNVRVVTGHRSSWTCAFWLALIACLGIVLGNPVFAETDDPIADVDEPVLTDVPLEQPTEPPSPPTLVPAIEPTSEPVPPTNPPAEAPTVSPGTEAPALPTADAPATVAPLVPTAAAVEPPVNAEPTVTLAIDDDGLACPPADGTDIDSDCANAGSVTAQTSPVLPPCPPTVSASENSLDFGSSRWNGSAYPPAPATLTLTIDATGAACSGLDGNWNIQVSALAMASSGGTHTIPPTSLAYTGSTPGGAPPTGVIPIPGPVTLDGAGTIATTTPSDSAGGSWSVAFLLSPPANSPPGVYTGTIVIDVVASSSD